MSYDLSIDKNNDLVFGPNKDLLGVSGTPIYDQRIRTRLKIKRASWVFDTDGTLGSRLDLVLGRASEQAMSEVAAFVHEALDDMNDISVTNVQVQEPTDSKNSMLTVIVGYQVLTDFSEAPFNAPDEQLEESVITFQL